jgi:hypothetical protein
MADTVNVNFRKKNTLPGQGEIPREGMYGLHFGFWGMVTELHPEDNTVHVLMDTGRELSGVRVASLEWVTIDEKKGFLSGERRLPPVDTYVYCPMPTGEPSSAFVLCSGFGYQVADHAAFKEDSEDAKFIKKRVDNSGWDRTLDYRTGTRKAKNKSESIQIEIDQEEDGKEKVKITIHSNIFTIDGENGIKIETEKDVDLTVKGKADIKADGNATVESKGNVSVKGINVTAEASAMLTLKSGDAAAWMPNCVPACPFGMPHGGPSAGIAKLKGS